MELQQVIDRRRMVRNYDPDRPVPADVRDRLLANALHAPSAGFSQGWAFLVLEDAGDRESFWSTLSPDDAGLGSPSGRAPRRLGELEPALTGLGPLSQGTPPLPDSRWLAGMRRAPLLIVPLAHKRAYLDRYAEPDKGWADRDEAHWPVPYWDIDTGFAALLMLLTAVDAGLGACFFGVPPERMAAFRAAFSVPADYTPIGAISVGYPAPGGAPGSIHRGRRPVEDVVHTGRW